MKLYRLPFKRGAEMDVQQNSSISRPGYELGEFNYRRQSALPFL